MGHMNSPASATQGVAYVEKLSPTITWWIVALFLSSMTAAMVYPVWPLGAIVVPVVVFALAATWLVTMGAKILVTDTHFYAGRAHIERSFITEVEPLGPSAAFQARGPQLDARAFLMIRPWVKQAVRVHIHDPADPTPYWVISTKRPAALAKALNS